MSVTGASPLAVDLVRTPSPSGDELGAARLLERWCSSRELRVVRDDAAVRVEVGDEDSGPTLLLASHLDTVPPGDGWTRDPYGGEIIGGRLHGRGAVDAKASVAAMAGAAAAIAADGGPPRGRLVVLATFGEETAASTMPEALRRLGRSPQAAIVGEPTGCEPCIAQRGLLVLSVSWDGIQMHAGWAAEASPAPEQAVWSAARDLAALAELRFERLDPRLGSVTVTATQLHAGVGRNVTPPRCEALLDVRTTPAYEHDEVVAAIRRTLSRGKVEVVSERLRPAATPEASPLLEAIRRAIPGARPFGSPTSSDWVFLRDVDAVKLGPGDSRLSHTSHESVTLSEIEGAAALYASIAREYLK